MDIRHKVFPNGYQNLGLMVDGKDKPILTTTIVLPGIYDFGFITRQEIITVVCGHVKINGNLFPTKTKSVYNVTAGSSVTIETDIPAVIICTFPETT